MVWIWLIYSSFVHGQAKLLHVLRGLLPDDGCSVHGHTLHAQSEGTKEAGFHPGQMNGLKT